MGTAVEPTTNTTWDVDPSHSHVEFAVKHMMISTVRGRFGAITGTVVSDGTAENSVIDVRIETTSIDTRDEKRDEHLRSPDFFDVANHPQIAFRSNRITGDLDGEFTVHGDLTIRGTTHPAVLKATSEGRGRDPWGNDRAGFSATTKINRKEFGLVWNVALEAGGVLVGEDIKITIDVELTRRAA